MEIPRSSLAYRVERETKSGSGEFTARPLRVQLLDVKGCLKDYFSSVYSYLLYRGPNVAVTCGSISEYERQLLEDWRYPAINAVVEADLPTMTGLLILQHFPQGYHLNATDFTYVKRPGESDDAIYLSHFDQDHPIASLLVVRGTLPGQTEYYNIGTDFCDRKVRLAITDHRRG